MFTNVGRKLCEEASRSLQDTISGTGCHRQQRLVVSCRSGVLSGGGGGGSRGGICPSGDIWRCLEMFLIISRVERVQLASNWERLINILHVQGSTLQQRIIWPLMSLVPGEQTLP